MMTGMTFEQFRITAGLSGEGENTKDTKSILCCIAWVRTEKKFYVQLT